MRHRGSSLAALVLLASMLLAACGGSGTTQSPTTAPAAGGAATTAPAAAAPTAAMAEATTAPTAAMMEATTAPTAAMMEATTSATSGAMMEATTSATSGAMMEATTAPAATGPTDYSKIGTELADAFAGKYKGTTVSLAHGVSGDEEVKFQATFKDFQDKTGITVKLVPQGNTPEALSVKVTAGTVEDIVNFPQPGLMGSYAKQGKIIDLNGFINQDWLKQNYKQGFIDTNTVPDASGKPILGGVFQRINFKGAIWYPKKAFADAGYAVPKTWAEMTALMDTIVADGDKPWCVGIESGGATGWPATDLTEQMMLRTTSLENYDKWTTGELTFNDPIVKNAVQLVSDTWLNDKYALGGRAAIASTNFGDAPTPMLQDPPKCWMYDQGNFITTFFERNKPGVKAGVDYDFFPLPAYNDQYGAPQEFGGDLFSMFNDRPEVRALIEYFTTYESIQPWIKLGGGAISPHNNAVLADYTTDLDRNLAQTVLNAPNVRFDGSDLMPAEVGSGSFWKGMTDYVSGSADLDQALTTIQNGWNNVKK